MEVASPYRVTGRGGRRASRRWFDEVLVGQMTGSDRTVIDVEGGRLGWWMTRGRLQRRYGIVASRLPGWTWTLRRVRSYLPISRPAFGPDIPPVAGHLQGPTERFRRLGSA